MKLFIVANFTSLPDEPGNCRFNYIAKEISKSVPDTTLVTSSFSHVAKKQRKNVIYKENYKIIEIPEPGYRKNITLKRFYSHYVWGKRVAKFIKQEKPDVIYCAVPSLTVGSRLSKLCKKEHIKFIIDVQDLWPEAFQMVFNPPIIGNLIYMPFRRIANGIYSNADEIIAVSKTYAERAIKVNKKHAKALVVFLGTSLKKFDQNARQFRKIVRTGNNAERLIIVKNADGLALNKPNDELWIAYCGTLGSSYDLETTVKAISLKASEQIRLIVMGDGPLKDKLVKIAKVSNIKATFTGRIPYEMMCGVLANCDIAVNPIMPNAAQSIINKHADYLAAGLPIVNTQDTKEFRRLVDKYKIGFNCDDDAEQLSKTILKLVDSAELRRTLSKNSRKCAMELFDREKKYIPIYDALKERSRSKNA